MQRSFAFLILVSALIIAAGFGATWSVLHGHGLPFTIDMVDARTAVALPNAGHPLPAGLQPGDRIDLPALDDSTRMAVVIQGLQGVLPAERTYQFLVQRASESLTVPVTTVTFGGTPRERLTQWVFCVFYVVGGTLALLVLWRGRGRAADRMAAWLTLSMFGFVCNFGSVFDGSLGIGIQMLGLLFYALGRVALYLVFDELVGTALPPRTRRFIRHLFIAILLAGTLTMMGGPLTYVISGWAGLLQPAYGILFTASYLVPALMLLLGYSHASEAQRPHLRWLLLSTLVLMVGIFLSNTALMDASTNIVVQSASMCLGISGFAYTVLFHRVVPVSMILDRTLVYGAITALVVGVVAAMNSLALRATLGDGAGLLLQIVVPLALGIVLSKVRIYMDRVVEQVFFRSKYLAEKSLRNFARQCGHIDDAQKLLDAAATEVGRQMRSPGVAFYEITDAGYVCLRQKGSMRYPKRLDPNDPAIVAVRADLEPVGLSDYASALGADGCAFPMTVLGVLRGVLVCADRPGEHLASDEKALLAEVAREVGAALRILRARDNEELVRALAKGTLKPNAARARAKALEAAWAGT
jgi:hypothetical protein